MILDRLKFFSFQGGRMPFYLYEGERLDDMVESIREHGVLNPVIVRKKGRVYEMISRSQLAECGEDCRAYEDSGYREARSVR